MPISQFGGALGNVMMFLPGTYGTSLIRNHCLGGVYREMSSIGFPSGVVEGIKDSVDCNIYFFGSSVPIGAMYAVILGAVVVLVGAYVLINVLKKRA